MQVYMYNRKNQLIIFVNAFCRLGQSMTQPLVAANIRYEKSLCFVTKAFEKSQAFQ